MYNLLRLLKLSAKFITTNPKHTLIAQILRIISTLTDRHNSFLLYWVHNHMDIQRNEQTDRVASTPSIAVPDLKIPISDFKNIMETSIQRT